MKNEIEIWRSEYELRQFIDTAIRWPIKGIYKRRTEKRPFSIFTEYVENARENFELFSNQLNKKLTDNKNWKAIGIDLEDRFLRMLNQYIDWYAENEKETEIFGSYNPYELMLSIIESTKKEILKYFPELSQPEDDNTFNLKKIENEIRKKPTITDKLNYWKEIKIKYIEEPLNKTKTKNIFDNSNYYKRLTELFGKDYKVVSPIKIPQHIYNEHFSNGLNEAEFTYWFLKYNAKEYFETIYRTKHLDDKLSSPIAKKHIVSELKELNDFEKKAYDLLLHKTINIYSPYYNSEHAQEIEFLRIKDNYYVKNILPDVHSVVNTTVELYAKHIYLKDFLESKLKELEASGSKIQKTQKNFSDPKKQLQNEPAPLLKTSPPQHNYKKHPNNLDLLRLPVAILEQYSISCEYRYINVIGFGKIPVPLFAILGVERHDIDIHSIPLKDYAKGFIQGYNSNLIPFIDNNDTRKEVILYESIFKGGKGFEESHTGKSIEYKAESMFESGVFEGKRYKAWEIIFETPSAFIQHFEPLPSQKTNEKDKLISRKENDLKKEKTFIDYLKHDNPKQLAQMLKDEFSGIKQKEVPLFIYSLIKNSLLKTGELTRTEIHRVLSDYFGKELGRTSKVINDYLDKNWKNWNHSFKEAEIKDFSYRIGNIRNRV